MQFFRLSSVLNSYFFIYYSYRAIVYVNVLVSCASKATNVSILSILLSKSFFILWIVLCCVWLLVANVLDCWASEHDRHQSSIIIRNRPAIGPEQQSGVPALVSSAAIALSSENREQKTPHGFRFVWAKSTTNHRWIVFVGRRPICRFPHRSCVFLSNRGLSIECRVILWSTPSVVYCFCRLDSFRSANCVTFSGRDNRQCFLLLLRECVSCKRVCCVCVNWIVINIIIVIAPCRVANEAKRLAFGVLCCCVRAFVLWLRQWSGECVKVYS